MQRRTPPHPNYTGETQERGKITGMKKALKIIGITIGSLLVAFITLGVIAAIVLPDADPSVAAPAISASTAAAPVTVDPTPTPSPTPAPATTTEPAPEPVATAPAKTFVDQIRDDVGSYANLITSAEETEPGRIEVGTSIVDPRGDNGSPEAQQAIAICEAVMIATGASYVNVAEEDGTTFVLAGHPTYGPDCTEV